MEYDICQSKFRKGAFISAIELPRIPALFLKMLKSELEEALEEYAPDKDEDMELIGNPEAFSAYMIGHAFEGLEDGGFRGSLWSCYDEFLDNEYQNKQYITEMLAVANADNLLPAYLTERGK